MSRIVAIREENIKFEGTVEYHFRDDRCGPFNVLENTNLVDGIGGVTWVRYYSNQNVRNSAF